MMKLNSMNRLMDAARAPEGGDGGGAGVPSPEPAPAASGGGSLLGADPTPSPAAAPTPTPDPTPTPAPDASDWRSTLPEELRNDPSLAPINDLQGLAKSFINAQKMVGRDKITIPDKHATPDDWKNIYHKLGLPQKFEDFQVEAPKDVPFQDGFITDFKKRAYEAGVLPKQAEEMLSWYADVNNQHQEQFQQKRQAEVAQQMEALKQEYGAHFNEKMSRFKHLMREAGDSVGSEQLYSWLNNQEVEGTALGSHPLFIKLIDFFSSKMAEDDFVNVEGSAQSKKSVQTEIDEVLKNPKHPYYDQGHPNHKDAVADLKRKYEMLYQDTGQSFI